MQPESDFRVCLEAIASALHDEFQPRAFLADGRTLSVFAELGRLGCLPPTERYTTDLRGAA